LFYCNKVCIVISLKKLLQLKITAITTFLFRQIKDTNIKRYAPVFLIVILLQSNVIAQNKKLNNAFYFSSGIAVDSRGNAFVTGKNNKLIKITPDGRASHFAGSKGGFTGTEDGINGKFSSTSGGITIDSNDNLYITDNTRIRKITPDGIISTIAGLLKAESKDGDKSTASFLHLENITIDNNGNMYVTDYAPGKDWRPGQVTNSSYYFIRKITAEGIVTTLQNGDAGALTLQYPRGLACDAAGNLYICASSSHCIKKITPGGIISTVAGQCDKTIYHSVYQEGNLNTAVLTTPSSIAIAKNGDIYFSDERLYRIIKIANNKVTTIAGSGKLSFTGNIAGAAEPGEKDGKALQAMFQTPTGIAFDKAGNLFIVDGSSRNNSYIRKLSTDGIVSTFCKHVWNSKTSQYEEAE
jgi:sugar lactone lactonase YvrE